MKKIAVLILTYNEEKNLRSCMESADFADEIIIVDSQSTDHTRTIAESSGAKVVIHPMKGFDEQRNFALTQTEADWVMYLDADERLTPEAGKEIRQLMEAAEAAYEIKRINIAFGQKMKYGGHAPDYSLRLYPRTAISWDGEVHEAAHVNLPVHQMKAYMYHHTYTDWNRYFIKLNQYTTMMAEKMYKQGKRANWSDFILRPLFAVFRFYILKLGFLEGRLGFVLAILHGVYTFAKYVKLYYWKEETTEQEL